MGDGPLVLVMRCKGKLGVGGGDPCIGRDIEIGRKCTSAIEFYFGGSTTLNLACCLYMTLD